MKLFQRFLFGKSPKKTLIRALIIAVVAYFTFTQVLIPTRNLSEGMQPTIRKGDLLWISRVPYLFGKVDRGDIVAIALVGGEHFRISRVVALPGEAFEVRDGWIYVNDERFENGRMRTTINEALTINRYPRAVLEENEYFVVGDYRDTTIEVLRSAGAFGRVQRSRIYGEVLFE